MKIQILETTNNMKIKFIKQPENVLENNFHIFCVFLLHENAHHKKPAMTHEKYFLIYVQTKKSQFYRNNKTKFTTKINAAASVTEATL